MLTDHEFKEQVASMRAHQKSFLTSHDAREQFHAQRSEAIVDTYLQQYFEPTLAI